MTDAPELEAFLKWWNETRDWDNGGIYETHAKKWFLAGWNTRADLSDAKDARIAELEAQNRELALQIISSDGQAMDAYDAQRESEQRAEAADAKLAKAMMGLSAMLPAAQQMSNPKMENTIRAILKELNKE